mmetsp:Transcript_25079/g.71615  ORF Transcript_25079/g.71615 Transcript_25079/m.71615 type:complete len:266 (+) Transcript_25079:317-1114(+)
MQCPWTISALRFETCDKLCVLRRLAVACPCRVALRKHGQDFLSDATLCARRALYRLVLLLLPLVLQVIEELFDLEAHLSDDPRDVQHVPGEVREVLPAALPRQLDGAMRGRPGGDVARVLAVDEVEGVREAVRADAELVQPPRHVRPLHEPVEHLLWDLVVGIPLHPPQLPAEHKLQLLRPLGPLGGLELRVCGQRPPHDLDDGGVQHVEDPEDHGDDVEQPHHAPDPTRRRDGGRELAPITPGGSPEERQHGAPPTSVEGVEVR